jgi:hypothetical protein
MTTDNSATKQPLLFSFSGLTLDQVNIILAGLGEVPFKLSSPLIQGIKEVAQLQIDAYNASQEAASEQNSAETVTIVE